MTSLFAANGEHLREKRARVLREIILDHSQISVFFVRRNYPANGGDP
ncbi:MAG TPA: hypothetical protein VH114_07700 [Candidatus Acidoferrum sp.]|nr:hypothetical protein [Candidatus Acidoferrum sp.]